MCECICTCPDVTHLGSKNSQRENVCQKVSRGRRTHTLEHAAAWHGKERSEGRRAEEKVKRSRKEHFNHVMTTEGSRAGADVTTRARAPCLGRVECPFQDCCVQLLLALALRSVEHEPGAPVLAV